MRKNCAEAMDAWNSNERGGKPGSAIWTDGVHVYSYQTCLLAYREAGDLLDLEQEAVVVVNATRYSVTTSTHQSGIAEYLNRYFGGDFIALDGFPFGVTPDEVLTRYDEEVSCLDRA